MIKSLYLGKSSEMLITSLLLTANRETYLPTVDDHGVDIIVRTKEFVKGDGSSPQNYEFQEIQVKSIEKGGLFAGFTCNPRPNYWFVFLVRQYNTIWLINSEEVYSLASINQKGKHIGKCSLSLATKKKISPNMAKFIVKDFSTLP